MPRHGILAVLILIFCSRAAVSVRPHQAISGVGENHCRDGPGLEHRLASRDRLGRNIRFTVSLVSQHRLPGDIADRENMRLGGSLLPVNYNKTFTIKLNSCFFKAQAFSIGTTADRDQDLLETSVALLPLSYLPG